VRLLKGAGLRAVAEISHQHGHIATIFIAATPEECVPYEFHIETI
jgi:hypothetical protein